MQNLDQVSVQINTYSGHGDRNREHESIAGTGADPLRLRQLG
jgi:hypothetical protein